MISRVYRVFKDQRDLTSGSILKNLLILSGPLLVSNFIQTLFNLADMFWVGKLGPASLAAVAAAGSILMMVFMLAMGISVGTAALVSRFVGAKDREKAGHAATQGLCVAILLAAIISFLGYMFSAQLLKLLGADAMVVARGTDYLKISFIGMVIFYFLFVFSDILRGAGDTFSPMVILSFSAVLNMVLDPFFIFGWAYFPRMGVAGAAVASLIAEFVAVVMALEFLLHGRSQLKLPKFSFDLDMMKKIVGIGIPATIQMILRSFMMIVMMVVVATFGTYAIAAYGVGMRLAMIVMMPGFALANAAATLMGQNLGAKDPSRAFQSAWTAVGLYIIFLAIVGFFFFFYAPQLIAIFNNTEEVIKLGSDFLRISTFGFVFIALGLVLTRALGGAGDTFMPMLITFISLWVFQIPLAILLSQFTTLNINGIWIAMLAANLVQGILAVIWFQKGKWKEKVL